MPRNRLKLWEAGSDAPDIRLETEQATGYNYVHLERREAGGWEKTGRAEVSLAMPIERRGDLADDVAAEWSTTQYHAAGDRTRVSRRLVVEDTGEGALEIAVEAKREEVLGFGRRDEHDWQRERAWEITYEAVYEQEVEG